MSLRKKDIGSIYSVDSVAGGTSNNSLVLQNRQERFISFYSMCRQCLSLIVQNHSGGGRRALLPAYTCRTVVDAFSQNGWEVSYYGIQRDLSIEKKSFIEKGESFSPDVVLIHPYYGMDTSCDELEAIESVKKSGAVVIKDLAQCIFSKEKNALFDYYVGSLRKWFPMPDGAFVASDKWMLNVSNVHGCENDPFVSAELGAMYLRECYLNSGDERIKLVSRKLDKAAQMFNRDATRAFDMSAYSRYVYGKADSEAVMQARLRNYRYLFDKIQDTPRVWRVCRDIGRVTTAALYFPIWVDDRRELVGRLINEKIYAPILWSIPNDKVLMSEDVQLLYAHILALPIDHRYGVEDMERIVKVVNT